MSDEDGETVELRREADGLRYYLAGEPLHAGDMLELLLDDGTWARVRYEYNAGKDQLTGFLWFSEDEGIRLDPTRAQLRFTNTHRFSCS